MTTLRFTLWILLKLWRIYRETAAVFTADPSWHTETYMEQVWDFVRIRLGQEFLWGEWGRLRRNKSD